MITEWQPILPSDEIRFKKRVLIELLFTNKHTEVDVGVGEDNVTSGTAFLSKGVVAWREFDCAADARRENPPLTIEPKKK